MTLSMVVEHLSMVVFAIVIAILIGVPLGLLCYLSRAARGVVLRVVDLIQTTPALALLGIIMVTPLGAGKPTVILGLALYSLLPIVRNVTLGLSQVSPAVKEAAKGMGMTRVYSLFHVELPLAMPMLFTGLRIAVVNTIGTAVFASSVGGGGLGNLINTGIRRNDVAMILSGTAALMAMALLLDNLMAFCERRMGRRDSSAAPAGTPFSAGGSQQARRPSWWPPVPALPAAQGHLQHPCPLRRGVLRGSVGQPHGAAACGGPHGAGGQHTRPHDLDQQLQGAHRAGAEL
ncbi:MAG: ABC transporter permease [Flavonifractor plautii]